MNIWPQKYRAILGAFVVTSLAASPSVKSCGDFRKPETHFDGVNEYGFVSYWDQLGEIKLADGSVLPLIIGFRSDWETLSPSPHLGSGWLLGLLDAHFVQRSESAFDMISIDGYTFPFGRDPKIPSILNGAQGWKAEIKGDIVTVWAECGWKLQFTKGKISAIHTPKNSVVQIRRDKDGVVNDVLERTTVLLKVDRDSKNAVVGLTLGEEKIIFQQVEKPLIQTVAGINVLSAKNYALGKIILPNGASKTLSYLPSPDLYPTISVTNPGQEDRIISWDPSNKTILSDDKWRYEVVTSSKPGLNAAISRFDEKGRKEFWHFDSEHGRETIQTFDSITQKVWFSSGRVSGLLRSESYSSLDGLTKKERRLNYDEKGALLRITDNLYNGEKIKASVSVIDKKRGIDSKTLLSAMNTFSELGIQ